MSKKKIIEVLFAAAVILLAANLLTAKYLKPSLEVKRNLRDLTSSQINDIFWNDLNAFALHSDWVKKLKSSSREKAKFNYLVAIPQDLPIPVVLKEIYESFYDMNVELNTAEKVIGGRTELKIMREGKTELRAVLNYDKDLKRKGETCGLIISGFGRLNKEDQYYLIKFPQTFAALLIPSKASVRLSDTLSSYRKEYAVLLNDEINDLDYKLRAGFSPRRIVSALRTIIGSFPKAIFYVIDDRSRLYNSTTYNLIKMQLTHRGILLIKLSKLNEISGSNSANLKSDFSSTVKSENENVPHFILIPAGDFKLLQPQIFSFIKIGYKFINPSKVLSAFNISKNNKD